MQRRAAFAVSPGLVSPHRAVAAPDIEFVGIRGRLPESPADWWPADKSKLWRYNLHYFDYLLWDDYDLSTKQRLLGRWMAECPPGTADAWEAYPLSMRVVNWIKFWGSGVVPTVAEFDSLTTQLNWLEGNLEYHLLANHLLKNGKALFFGGIYCQGPAADRWLAQGLAILLAEADEQVLADGGHFERSPMYHSIVLEDYLDVLNLAAANGDRVSDEAVARLAATARRAALFLARITAGDGRIPLFNDAAFGIAPEPAELLAYAQRVLGRLEDLPEPEASLPVHLPATGYFGYRSGGDSLLIDCGPVGPDYQPGHAHCDTLSYELCVDGQRVVVDAGVYSYESDAMRHYVRSTAGHNTVMVDGAEQSEIWSAFRVARRAYPLAPTLSQPENGVLTFTGGHDGYRRLKGSPTHTRTVRMDPRGRWEFIDVIEGSRPFCHRLVNRIHLNFHISVETGGPGVFLLRHDITGLRLTLTVTCGSPARVEPGYHCPEFGICRDNNVIVIEREGTTPLETRYQIERA